MTRTRSATIRFSEDSLVELWRPFVAITWAWDGSQYNTKASRAVGPDRAKLESASEPLAALAKMAPNGYPAHSCLKGVLNVLQDELDIFKLKDDKGEILPGLVSVKCNQAADVWRIMLKHSAVVKPSV